MRNVEHHKYFGEELLTRIRGISTRQRVIEKFSYTLRNYSGGELNINDIENEFGVLTASKIAFRESSLTENVVIIDDATIEDKNTGKISFTLPAEVRDNAGVYIADIGLVDSTDDKKLYWSEPFYIYNEPSHWSTESTSMLRLADIRLSLRDSSYIENELLGNYEFDVAEIAFAVTRTVQYWNETPPPARLFSTRNFPFRDLLLTGTQLYLFDLLEEHYRRNEFPYSVGGLSIDDKRKFQNYRIAWQDRFSKFARDMAARKAMINAQGAVVAVGGSYIWHQF